MPSRPPGCPRDGFSTTSGAQPSGQLIRAGVDETTAMKLSGHTRSMLTRYNIVTERETADALLRADAFLSTQPRERNVEEGQFGDMARPPPASR